MGRYLLTRRAALDLRDIYDYSRKSWGDDVAKSYMATISAKLQGAASRPEIGVLRQHRSYPFKMVPVGKHYAIYKEYRESIVVATILHSKRDIESIISVIADALFEEIQQIESELV